MIYVIHGNKITFIVIVIVFHCQNTSKMFSFVAANLGYVMVIVIAIGLVEHLAKGKSQLFKC